MEPAPARARGEPIDHDDRLVREWQMARLSGLRIPWALARAAADHVELAWKPGQAGGAAWPGPTGHTPPRRPEPTVNCRPSPQSRAGRNGTITRQLTVRTSYIPARPAHQEV
jgi:hypothetical protein